MINTAYIKGLAEYPWWPNWDGECAAIVAGGYSIKSMDLSVLQNHIHVIAVKAAVDLCPYAEVVYGCDAAWWLDRQGLPKYKGIKLFHGSQAANRWPDMRKVEIDLKSDAMLVDKPLRLGNGGNSGFQAMNLAIQFGAKDIILLGIDCNAADQHGSLHWYGRNKWNGANNPQGSNFKRWKDGFNAAKKSIDALHVDVVNCSEGSALNTFRKAPLGIVMQEWGLC